MKRLLILGWLLSALFLNAQTATERKTITLDDIQWMLKDETSELSKLKREIIGQGDTNRFFYFPTHDQPATPLYDISGDKMKLILDFPTTGEPHYAESIPAALVMPNSTKIYKLEENKHPYAALGEGQTKVERKGKEVHVYMTAGLREPGTGVFQTF